jgi:hypothetical protein
MITQTNPLHPYHTTFELVSVSIELMIIIRHDPVVFPSSIGN